MIVGMSTRYQLMIRTLRRSLINEKDKIYLMHTPMGTLNVHRWIYKEDGFVFVEGFDEKGEFRFYALTDEQACSMPIEVADKADRDWPTSKDAKRIGFNAPSADTDQVEPSN